MEAANSLKKQMWAEAQLDNSCMRDVLKLGFQNLSSNKTESTMEVFSNDLHKSPTERALINQETNTSQENCSSKRSRSQLKSYIGGKAEEVYPYRSLPLGQDRRHNRYWHFAASASKTDPCSGLIFVELHDGKWRLIDSEEVITSICSYKGF